MLFLRFQIGDDRYAMDIASIVEVLPLLDIRPLAHSSRGVSGVFNYRGTPVPVIDLSQVTHGRPADRRMSTRIVLLRYSDADGQSRLLGLVAEKVQTALSKEAAVGRQPAAGAVPALTGTITTDDEGLLHWLDVGSLLKTGDIPVESLAQPT